MFGYITPDKNELKVRELARYNAHYCGLCKSIGKKYGQFARITLSYDCAFLSMLLCGIAGDGECKMQRCGYKPLAKKKPVVLPTKLNEFAADVCLLLTLYKLKDDWQDEKHISALLLRGLLVGSNIKLKHERTAQYNAIDEKISLLSKMEKSSSPNIDEVGDVFAGLMGGLIALAPLRDIGAQKILVNMAENLGRWIYFLDAWDDREKDIKNRQYNPFVAAGADINRARRLINISLNQAINAYNLLDIASDKEILDNIMYCGCVKKTIEIVGEEAFESI